jgi:hypothetical protein
MQLIQKGNTPNTPIEAWVCDTEQEVNEIPSNAPIGSIAIILSDGMTIKMKNNAGNWVAL